MEGLQKPSANAVVSTLVALAHPAAAVLFLLPLLCPTISRACSCLLFLAFQSQLRIPLALARATAPKMAVVHQPCLFIKAKASIASLETQLHSETSGKSPAPSAAKMKTTAADPTPSYVCGQKV